jgi:phospholipid/cholesterol/gamma-HCH transport system ATP-binding protein
LAAVRRAADQIYLIAGGKIAAQGDPETLARGDTPWTRQFFSGEADGPVPFQYPAPDYATQLGLGETKA